MEVGWVCVQEYRLVRRLVFGYWYVVFGRQGGSGLGEGGYFAKGRSQVQGLVWKGIGEKTVIQLVMLRYSIFSCRFI